MLKKLLICIFILPIVFALACGSSKDTIIDFPQNVETKLKRDIDKKVYYVQLTWDHSGKNLHHLLVNREYFDGLSKITKQTEIYNEKVFIDLDVKLNIEYTYTVFAVNNNNQQSEGIVTTIKIPSYYDSTY